LIPGSILPFSNTIFHCVQLHHRVLTAIPHTNLLYTPPDLDAEFDLADFKNADFDPPLMDSDDEASDDEDVDPFHNIMDIYEGRQ
jgi:hypothetical protein